MKLRTFINSLFTLPIIGCTIPVVGNSPEEIKHRKDISNIQLKDYPIPVEKTLTCQYGEFEIRFTVTNQVLIPCKDLDGSLYYETNQYKTYNKVIAEVTLKNKPSQHQWRRHRFEGPLFTIDELDKRWNDDTKAIMAKLDSMKESDMEIITNVPFRTTVNDRS